MTARAKIIFHAAGHDFNPVYDQVEFLKSLLGSEYRCHKAESLAALEHLGECDLLILVGMYYTGWEGRYRTPGTVHRRAIEQYILAGKPLIFANGSIVSYDDWPRFAELVGIRFASPTPTFTPLQTHHVHVTEPSHPMMLGIEPFEVMDAIPTGVAIDQSLNVRVVAEIEWDGSRLPAVVGATRSAAAGAGKVAFLGFGHDLQCFAARPVQQIWLNTVRWCLTEP